MKVEVQMRTIAMDFWASIEHKLYYKKQTDGFPDSVSEDLGICAEQLHTIAKNKINCILLRKTRSKILCSSEDSHFAPQN